MSIHVPTNEEIEAIQHLADSGLTPLGFSPEPIYPLLPTPLKGAGGRALTFRRLDWAPDDLVEASRWVVPKPGQKAARVYLLQSLAVCAHCGRRLRVQTPKNYPTY